MASLRSQYSQRDRDIARGQRWHFPYLRPMPRGSIPAEHRQCIRRQTRDARQNQANLATRCKTKGKVIQGGRICHPDESRLRWAVCLKLPRAKGTLVQDNHERRLPHASHGPETHRRRALIIGKRHIFQPVAYRPNTSNRSSASFSQCPSKIHNKGRGGTPRSVGRYFIPTSVSSSWRLWMPSLR